MTYTPIPSSLTIKWKASVRRLFNLVSLNFRDHQSRINSLENFVSPIPSGTIVRYASSTVPTGYLSCDGSAVSRSTYSDLFSKIGTTYGSGDGSTTFNLPDCRDKVTIGAGQGSGLTNRVVATSVGANTHSLTVSEMPSHTHGTANDSHRHDFDDTGDQASPNQGLRFVDTNGSPTGSFLAVESSTTGINQTDNQGSGTAHNNMQPYVVCQFLIKT